MRGHSHFLPRAALSLVASFNHGDYFKDALPLLGVALTWLGALIAAILVFIGLFLCTKLRKLLRLCVIVWILTAGCAFFHTKTSAQFDSTDALVTTLPGIAAAVLFVIACLLSRYRQSRSSSTASERHEPRSK